MSQPISQVQDRSQELDVLRGVAILLVLWGHLGNFWEWMEPLPLAFRRFINYTDHGGWIGVDLFFVLSGFLISGLLFREYIDRGQIDCGRFLVRRGLKIYPAFWAFTALTVFLWWNRATPSRIAAELLYVQNYSPSLWRHTWSLAVEEHFYVLLPVCLITLIWLSRRKGHDAGNALNCLPLILVAVAILSLVLRVQAVATRGQSPDTFQDIHSIRSYTHTRIDSLAFGVFLSFLHHFRRERLSQWISRLPSLQTFCAFAWLVVPFLAYRILWEGRMGMFMATAGYTLLYLAWGTILIQFLYATGKWKGNAMRRLKFVSYVGLYSYSIYLWHLAVIAIVQVTIDAAPIGNGGKFLFAAAAYLVGSVAWGIIMAKAIEIPVLNIRDRVFPSRSKHQNSIALKVPLQPAKSVEF